MNTYHGSCRLICCTWKKSEMNHVCSRHGSTQHTLQPVKHRPRQFAEKWQSKTSESTSKTVNWTRISHTPTRRDGCGPISTCVLKKETRAPNVSNVYFLLLNRKKSVALKPCVKTHAVTWEHVQWSVFSHIFTCCSCDQQKITKQDGQARMHAIPLRYQQETTEKTDSSTFLKHGATARVSMATGRDPCPSSTFLKSVASPNLSKHLHPSLRRNCMDRASVIPALKKNVARRPRTALCVKCLPATNVG